MVDEGQRMFAEGLVSSSVLFTQFDHCTHISKVNAGAAAVAIFQPYPRPR